MRAAESDFNHTIDRAGALVLDATCELRGISNRPLPQPHRRLLDSAIVDLERTQQRLFVARNDPWSTRTPSQPTQLRLL